MKTLPLFSLAAATLPLANCMTASGDPPIVEDREPGSGGTCIAEAAQRFVGNEASSDTGAAILRATGARSLRWGYPGAVFTMDFREDRVNVMYDAAMTITEIRCG